MIGYALGATQYKLPDYLNEQNLAVAFQKAHKLLFALAAHSLMSKTNKIPEPRQGYIQGYVDAVVIDRRISIWT